MGRSDVVADRLKGLAAGFARYVDAYDELTPFTSEQARTHRGTIAGLKAAGSVEAAVSDHDFVVGLYKTLQAWRMGMRASYLVTEDEFVRMVRQAAPAIADLERFRIDDPHPPADIADRIWRVMDALGVVKNKARLVAGTKTLHHLVPDLVVPMDREWTGRFFRLHPPEWQVDQRRTFGRVHAAFAAIARAVDPESFVTGVGWRTSRTKIIDNALIAYCRLELDNDRTLVPSTQRTSFTVEGLPPAKNEALSMLGAGHAHATRVRNLLCAARDALALQSFSPMNTEAVALDVVVHTAPGDRLSDATNFLGGVADVLENKTHRGALAHLGDLATVSLYENDRQIKQVTYREVVDTRSFYTVTVSTIG